MANGTDRCPQQKICGYEYTVKRGDSFYLIAHRLGVPLRDLLEANTGINPARLMMGDVLCIPMEEDDAVNQPAQEPEQPVCPPCEQQTPEDAGQTGTDTNTDTGAEADPTPLQPIIVPTPTPEIPDDGGEAQGGCTAEQRYVVQAGETVEDIQQMADVSRKTLAAANPGVDLSMLRAGEMICVPMANTPCGTARFYRLAESEDLEKLALQLDVSVAALLRANPCLAPSDFKGGVVVSLP